MREKTEQVGQILKRMGLDESPDMRDFLAEQERENEKARAALRDRARPRALEQGQLSLL